MRLPLIAALAFVPLAACSTVAETVRGPNLSPVGYPSALTPNDQNFASVREPQPQAASANSLWRVGARTFFGDQRAARVGDILTVQIDIDDSARTQNSTATSRAANSKMGVPHFFGLESSLGKILPGGFDPSAMVETGSNSTKAGSGSISRSEKISLTVAAVVTGVMPNGNMVIQGTQEVLTNGELRRLTVSGLVRPEDISAANTIKHTQIAEARIAYGGRGDISRAQKTPVGQGLVETFTPF
ncbi:flagellar basal body L-ring protein FlgH [Caulobacter mirabilis]|uniref:Flagellar L-ring protein n=1 Tax=Caulobacter mirabilis TaxID=69666 RepID=A0A2D2B0E9_9CAUL|nr:flagellar basal body L-ring protein FlgH [Caulobacter mirabilis]ATQ43713.1 flagellar basal body L-ring protein [Caulobacter mirabilis]